MGAEVIIFGQSLNSNFLKGLTHSAVELLLAQSSNKVSSSIPLASNSNNHLKNPSAVWIYSKTDNIQVKPNQPNSGTLKRCQKRNHKNKSNKGTIQPILVVIFSWCLHGWAEGIQTYYIRLVCTVIRCIQYLQYLIPQPPVGLKVDKKSITIFKLI